MITCTLTADEVRGRLAVVRERIERAGADPAGVTVLAVTKGFDRTAVDLAAAAGLTELGENYGQELLAKAPDAPAGTAWHMIGRLQRNKVRQLAPHVALWQTVDRIELGAEIAKRAPGAAVLVQVHATDEPQKGGCPPADVPALVRDLRAEGLDVRGLMAVGHTAGPEPSRAGFARVNRLADDLDLPVRSMGMSADLEVAVAEGSTMVRVGTGLFGPRAPKAARGN